MRINCINRNSHIKRENFLNTLKSESTIDISILIKGGIQSGLYFRRVNIFFKRKTILIK